MPARKTPTVPTVIDLAALRTEALTIIPALAGIESDIAALVTKAGEPSRQMARVICIARGGFLTTQAVKAKETLSADNADWFGRSTAYRRWIREMLREALTGNAKSTEQDDVADRIMSRVRNYIADAMSSPELAALGAPQATGPKVTPDHVAVAVARAEKGAPVNLDSVRAGLATIAADPKRGGPVPVLRAVTNLLRVDLVDSVTNTPDGQRADVVALCDAIARQAAAMASALRKVRPARKTASN